MGAGVQVWSPNDDLSPHKVFRKINFRKISSLTKALYKQQFRGLQGAHGPTGRGEFAITGGMGGPGKEACGCWHGRDAKALVSRGPLSPIEGPPLPMYILSHF